MAVVCYLTAAYATFSAAKMVFCILHHILPTLLPHIVFSQDDSVVFESGYDVGEKIFYANGGPFSRSLQLRNFIDYAESIISTRTTHDVL